MLMYGKHHHNIVKKINLQLKIKCKNVNHMLFSLNFDYLA